MAEMVETPCRLHTLTRDGMKVEALTCQNRSAGTIKNCTKTQIDSQTLQFPKGVITYQTKKCALTGIKVCNIYIYIYLSQT